MFEQDTQYSATFKHRCACILLAIIYLYLMFEQDTQCSAILLNIDVHVYS